MLTARERFEEFYHPYVCNIEDGQSGSVADSNGDDKIAILFKDNVYDIFGVPGQNADTNKYSAQNFENGRAERKAHVIEPNITWNEADWNTWRLIQDAGITVDFDPQNWIGSNKSI